MFDGKEPLPGRRDTSGPTVSCCCRHRRLLAVSFIKPWLLTRPLQVLGAGSIRPTLPAGPDVDLWPPLPQQLLHRHGVPLHHLQHAAGDVHLRVPLSPPEEGITFRRLTRDQRLLFLTALTRHSGRRGSLASRRCSHRRCVSGSICSGRLSWCARGGIIAKLAVANVAVFNKDLAEVEERICAGPWWGAPGRTGLQRGREE